MKNKLDPEVRISIQFGDGFRPVVRRQQFQYTIDPRHQSRLPGDTEFLLEGRMNYADRLKLELRFSRHPNTPVQLVP
jgi:hypothetical protein